MMTIPTTVFTISLSMSDWIYVPDEDGPFLPNADLQAVLDAMHIKVNLCELCDFYFDEIAVGSGDIVVFSSATYANTYFIVDCYRELTDQLDIVTFYIYSPDTTLTKNLKLPLRHFFDNAQYKILYQEACALSLVEHIMQTPSGEQIRVIEESNYGQRVWFRDSHHGL